MFLNNLKLKRIVVEIKILATLIGGSSHMCMIVSSSDLISKQSPGIAPQGLASKLLHFIPFVLKSKRMYKKPFPRNTLSLISNKSNSFCMFKSLRMLPQKKSKLHFFFVCPPKKPFSREYSP